MENRIELAGEPSLEQWLIATVEPEPEVRRERELPANRDPLVWFTALAFSSSATALGLAIVAAVILL